MFLIFSLGTERYESHKILRLKTIIYGSLHHRKQFWKVFQRCAPNYPTPTKIYDTKIIPEYSRIKLEQDNFIDP